VIRSFVARAFLIRAFLKRAFLKRAFLKRAFLKRAFLKRAFLKRAFCPALLTRLGRLVFADTAFTGRWFCWPVVCYPVFFLALAGLPAVATPLRRQVAAEPVPDPPPAVDRRFRPVRGPVHRKERVAGSFVSVELVYLALRGEYLLQFGHLVR